VQSALTYLLTFASTWNEGMPFAVAMLLERRNGTAG